MIVSYNWLKELVKLNVSAEKLAEEMSLYSVEVESFKKLIDATNLVVGLVTSKKKHENSDHLNVCMVNFGDYELQIVCGAPNVEVGQKVIVALPDAVLPGGIIKKSIIRGIESNGMICSLQELGLESKYIPSEYAHGIYVLKDDAKVGSNALEYLCLDDYAIELGLTPNRMDLLSMLGVANDVKAMYHSECIPLKYEFHEIDKLTSDQIQVTLNTKNCYSYYARVIEDVTIKESPNFIKARLIASGIRPINNVVDITNYVLMLFGQPLHSFDKDKLGHNIVVRRAKDGEKTVTLDGIERTLNNSDIVITDGEKPVCIAGVMGSQNTEVTPLTKNIVLESAVFRPLSIRKTSSKLSLRSESSVRYERGVDLNQSLDAVNYACYLLEKYADGKILKGYVHQGMNHIDDKLLVLDEKYVESCLGVKITKKRMIEILTSLSFKVEEDQYNILVYVPNRRLDITIKEDLVEEIARINGYDKLEETLPLTNVNGGLTKKQKIRRLIRHTLSTLGFNETITYSLVNPQSVNEFSFSEYQNDDVITLSHPMSEDHMVLRKSLLPSLVEVLKYHQARKMKDNMFFEMGKKYYQDGEETYEETLLSGIVTGMIPDNPWHSNHKNIDFFYVKGILDLLFRKLRLEVKYEAVENPPKELHPNRVAKIVLNQKTIGFIGELHPKYVKKQDIDESYVFELFLDTMLSEEKPIISFTPISKVPSVERDLALVMNLNQNMGEIIEAIKKSDKMISNVKIFDVYIGEKIANNQKSVALRITLESNETLTEEIISTKINKILKSLAYRFGITLRS